MSSLKSNKLIVYSKIRKLDKLHTVLMRVHFVCDQNKANYSSLKSIRPFAPSCISSEVEIAANVAIEKLISAKSRIVLKNFVISYFT